jgi:TonB family protein
VTFRGVYSGLLATVLFCSGVVVAASPEWLVTRAERLFQRVYAQPSTECPAGLESVGDSAGAVCAVYDGGISRLKKTLKQFDDRPSRTVTQAEERDDGLPASPHTGFVLPFYRTWRKQGDLHVRDWLEDDELIVIAYDETAGRLAVLPKDSCLDPQVRAREDLYFEGGDEFIEAGAIESPLPTKPGKAPNGMTKEGDAVVQFVVDREGNVADACVMLSRPGGFGKRALKAIEHWVFVPATIDGEPVDSVVSVAFRWRQHSWDYERTSRYVRP